jgi:hypothetical protein
MLAFTASAAETTSDIGWYGISARLTYASYKKDKSNDINTLALATERAIYAKGNEKIYLYTKELLEHDHFKEYAIFNDSEIYFNTGYSYEDFIKRYHYTAMYRRKKSDYVASGKEIAVILATGDLESEGVYIYNAGNPLIWIAKLCAEDTKAPQSVIDKLLDFYDKAYDYLSRPDVETDIETLRCLCADAWVVANAHGSQTQRTFWTEECQKNGLT